MTLMPGTTMSKRIGRSLLATALSTTVAAGVVAVNAAPAAAYDVRYEENTSWAYTDSHRPTKVYIDQAGDVPVGSWADDRGRPHTARAYFTFDITRYQGAVIELAKFDAKEVSAADCTKRPEVELWRTAPYTSRSSWAKPPADLAKLDTTTLPAFAGCPASYVGFDATEGLRQALAEGRTTLTLSLRLPAGTEQDRTLARRYATEVGLSIDHNYPPGVPTDPQTTAGKACTTSEPYQLVRGELGLSAVLHDRDRNDTGGTDMLTATFALWPVDEPGARIERIDNARDGDRAVGRFGQDLLQHDRVYAWQVRAADSRATGEWSDICYLRTDFRGPAVAPKVTSTDFPSGDPGAPALTGEFVFDANGAEDVVGFGYRVNSGGTRTVTADRQGGSATVSVTPDVGVNRVEVWSLDAAGNRSVSTSYDFLAHHVGPIVEGTLAAVGVPTTFAVRPGMDGVVRYRFHLDGDPEQSVDARADGTASVTVTANRGGSRTLTVISETANGVAAPSRLTFNLPTEPMITATVYEEYGYGGGQGVPGVFTFTPRLPETVRYRYSFGEETATVDAAADGTASVTWSPSAAGFQSLAVWSISRDGTESQPATWYFTVRDLLPGILANPYGQSGSNGGPGQAGQFRFTSEVPDTVEYRYRFDNGPEQGVGADANGSAQVTWTPEQGGTHTLMVRGVTADGTVSPVRTHTFEVYDAPLVESADYPRNANSGLPGAPGVFTFRPQRPDVVTYRYSFGGEEKTVEAAADGGATVTWTPEWSGWHQLTVRGVTHDGTVTQMREHVFSVREPKPSITSYLYYEYDPMGGIGVPGGFRFSSELPSTVEFVYQLNDGPEQTVAVTDGTAVDLTVTPDRGFRNTLTVRSRSASGELSPAATYVFTVSTSPTVGSTTYPYGETSGGVNVPGVFTFAPRMPNVDRYVYQFDNGPEVTVPAAPDGTASVTLTPTEARWYPLSVFAVDAAGNRSDVTYHWFVVQG